MKLGLCRGFIAIATVILATCLLSQSLLCESRGQTQNQNQNYNKEKRKVIIDQDAAGPAGSDQQAILLLIQSPQTEVLGVTVVTGDAWLTEEVAHTLRMLELIGRTDIPVFPACQNEGRDGAVGTALWLGGLAGRVDSEVLSCAARTWRDARRQAHHQDCRRRRCPLSGAHGAQVSARNHDLRGRPDDQPGAGDFTRSGISEPG